MGQDIVHNIPSEADAAGACVHVHGPSDVDISLTPEAALETAKRIGDAAVEVIIEKASPTGRLCKLPVG